MTLTHWLQGKKTYFLAAGLFTLALAAVVNGWTEADLAALATSVAMISAALRGGIDKAVSK